VQLDSNLQLSGYRYELFCATKAVRTTQCTVFCTIDKNTAWSYNLKRSQKTAVAETDVNQDDSEVPYNIETFDSLWKRFEEPNSNCRWDKPLFVVFPNNDLNNEEIYNALYESTSLLPNHSTQNVS